MFCYFSVSCIWRFVKTLFSQKFSKNFSMRSFFEELFARYHCFISNILAFQEIALQRYLLTANFIQVSYFCTETQFQLINCLFLEKNYLQKTLKKIPSGPFWTPHHKPLLRASFCANEKFQAFCGKTLL